MERVEPEKVDENRLRNLEMIAVKGIVDELAHATPMNPNVGKHVRALIQVVSSRDAEALVSEQMEYFLKRLGLKWEYEEVAVGTVVKGSKSEQVTKKTGRRRIVGEWE